MTDAPICPGVAEYLYQAASSAAVVTDGTWTVPSGLRPRCRSRECTPMAGMSTETGTDRDSDGPRPSDPVAPAADADGCGACTCEAIAKPTAARPPSTSAVPAKPANRARGLRGAASGGPGEYGVSGQDMTTLNPPMRRHLVPPNAVLRACFQLSRRLPNGALLA